MRVVLGVGGGIAAYKAAELVRQLQQRGHEIQVVMTGAAREFIQPLTFAALTGKKVITDLFAGESANDTLASAVEHIGVAQSHEALVVAPATADLLAKFATGQASDFLSTLHLAFTGPVILAPSMNSAMWEHAATQQNLETLRARGCFIIQPDEGWLACGTTGAGRFPNPERIAAEIDLLTEQRKDLAGESMLITAGPTQEALDPVRYISNRSSGKMGFALAEVAARRGARVTLVAGPVHLNAPANVQLISVRTAQEMRRAVLDNLDGSTIIIKSAAVADYYLSEVPKQKLKKTATRLSLELDPTPDILAEIGSKKGDRLLVGFAAETDNLIGEARRKMADKHCDMLVANLVNRDGLGFEADRNEVDIITRSGKAVHAGPADKKEVAEKILDQVAMLRLSFSTAESKT
jgi:phosphopantothenoylcysteine decarboxylase/phosphopantothenate--cysteine ligase